MRADVVDMVVKIEDPSERLLGRRDVITFRTEHDDGRADVAQVYGAAVGGLDPAGGKIVADEQLIDNELDLAGIQVDVPAPVALEAEIARDFRIDLRVDIILFGPYRVRRIEVLEILHQPCAVELATAEIAGEGGEPTAAEETAAVAHRVFAVHARPVRQRRAGNDNWAKQLRPHSGEHHYRPARLAVADDARFAFGVGMQGDDLFKEHRLGTRNVLDRLA